MSGCVKCGGRMMGIQVDHNPGLLRCESCKHEVYFCFDPALPESATAEDDSEGVLRLEDPGPHPLSVASAIRSLTGFTSQQALAFIRSGGSDIARRNPWRIWELEKLKQELDALGAQTAIVRSCPKPPFETKPDMNALSLEPMRRRLQLASMEPPPAPGFAAIAVLWRFPHLQSTNQSWTVLSAKHSPQGLLRVAEWDRFSDSQEIRIKDTGLSSGDLLRIFEVLTSLEIVGDQRGGIYDGPTYGLGWFGDQSGKPTEVSEWIHDQTLERLIDRLPPNVRSHFAFER